MGALVSAIAFPNPPKDYSADELRARPDLQFFQTKSGMKIPAVHIRHPRAKFTIIYSHGNAEDVGISLYYLDIVSHVLKASVIAYEYPGTKDFGASVFFKRSLLLMCSDKAPASRLLHPQDTRYRTGTHRKRIATRPSMQHTSMQPRQRELIHLRLFSLAGR
jgi:hypothetical protein